MNECRAVEHFYLLLWDYMDLLNCEYECVLFILFSYMYV